MSSFKGQIEELENILIDNFLFFKSHTCFFLSHCHLDHMSGLDRLFSNFNSGSNYYLYCSSVSRLILLNKFNLGCENVVKVLNSTEVITVPGNDVAPSYQITVTPIPAGHCPGSVMFLFETVRKTILYTGDFRILKNDISRFKPFFYKKQIKLIDKLYFDSTFLNEIYWDFPLRSEIINVLLKLINSWMRKNPKNNVLLETSALHGYEFLFAEVARKLKCKIHVKDLLYDLFWNIPDIGNYLTKHCATTRLHATRSFDKKCLLYNDKKLLRIKLSAQWYKSSKNNLRLPFWKKISCRNIFMCYSTHCSCSELVHFLNYLRPKSLEPCSAAVGSTKEETETYTERLVLSWDVQKRKKSPEAVKVEPHLEKNYKFKLQLPPCENKIFLNSLNF